MSQIVIQCPQCQWQPDGGPYWRCSCGHRWDTFLTKGKCPACGIQWQDTSCPECHQSSPHTAWYADLASLPPDDQKTARLKKKRAILLQRLREVGIRTHIPYLPYVDDQNETFRSPQEAGYRLLILCSVSYAAENLDEKLMIVDWLKRQHLWDKTSEKEKTFLLNLNTSPEEVLQMSWRTEAAVVLAWCLRLISTLPPIDRGPTDRELEEFVSAIPPVGSEVEPFMKDLDLRSREEIYEENLFNELVTSHLRDLMITGQPNMTKVIEDIVMERHYVLNWLRRFGDNDDWDTVDTST